ncbi:DNA cytosine methyltransferase [Xanthomonas oryzae]|uniref:DNA cytosine methyltransferase n=1 Tax=Xanthomonas oryzae TaxID=347 RepID=UPI0009EAA7A9|nr:DNA cytosine methyltransferase [Xanthomonas oryzae]QBG91095.1 DNA cytosine methyltransferase [Xanthomonas oryzae]
MSGIIERNFVRKISMSPYRQSVEQMQASKQDKGIPVVSLFCGAGGLDSGFAETGFRTIYAADYMDCAVKSFNHNLGHDVAEVVDLLKVSSDRVVRKILDRAQKLGCAPRGLLGGPPCQGVSSANNQSGPDDPRNRLFSRYVNIVLKLEEISGLDFFVFENVPALKEVQKNRPLYEKVVKRLKGVFNLHEAILDASQFGVAQRRRRLIIVGLNKKLDNQKFTMPTSNGDAQTVRSVIAGLPEPVFFRRGLDSKTNAFHPNHWTMMPKSEKFKSDYIPPKDGRSFIRLDWDKPSRTVAYGNREIHVHPEGTRRISVYEAMRIQGFPENYELIGNLSEQVTQVSNAVPPPVAKAVAASIIENLPKER